ncbi:MAG: GNAT family N-acetyltransferase [Verrucomicrobia bacterium]|nr:GNAT family N-acetyltransferase [Verrucomicrobiota bacterium]
MITQLDETAIPLALDFRLRMMTEAGVTPLLADDWRELTRNLYIEGYHNGSIAHFGWLEDGRIVATAGVMIRDDFPFFTFKARRYGWIMDVYVLPEYRRRGYARLLTEHTLTWLREKGVPLARLSASAQAKQAGLYERMGFTTTNEMRLWLDEPTKTPKTAQ